MSYLIKKLAGSVQPLSISHKVSAGARPAGERGWYSHSCTLGKPHPRRKFYALITSRTNTTTGFMWWEYCRLILGGVNYNGTRLVGPTSDSINPAAIYEFLLPTGQGSATINILTSRSGPVAYGLSFWEVNGHNDRLGAHSTGGNSTLTSAQGGAHLMMGYSSETPLSPSGFTGSTLNYSTDGFYCRAGWKFPTESGNSTLTISGVQSSLGVTVG